MLSRHGRCQRDPAGHHDHPQRDPGSGRRPQFRRGKRPNGRGQVKPIVVPSSTGMVAAPVRGRGHGRSIVISRRSRKHYTRRYAQYSVELRIKWLLCVKGRLSAQHAVCRIPRVTSRDAAAGSTVPPRRLRDLKGTAGSRTFSVTDAGCLASPGSAAGRTADVLTGRPVREHRAGSMGHVDRGRQAATEGSWSAPFTRHPGQRAAATARRRSAAPGFFCRRRAGTGSRPLRCNMLRGIALLCCASQPGDRKPCRGSRRAPGGVRRALPLEFIHGCQTICTAWSFEGRGRRRGRPSPAGRDPALSFTLSPPAARAHLPAPWTPRSSVVCGAT